MEGYIPGCILTDLRRSGVVKISDRSGKNSFFGNLANCYNLTVILFLSLLLQSHEWKLYLNFLMSTCLVLVPP